VTEAGVGVIGGEGTDEGIGHLEEVAAELQDVVVGTVQGQVALDDGVHIEARAVGRIGQGQAAREAVTSRQGRVGGEGQQRHRGAQDHGLGVGRDHHPAGLHHGEDGEGRIHIGEGRAPEYSKPLIFLSAKKILINNIIEIKNRE
jgi:hypothetical protein